MQHWGMSHKAGKEKREKGKDTGACGAGLPGLLCFSWEAPFAVWEAAGSVGIGGAHWVRPLEAGPEPFPKGANSV